MHSSWPSRTRIARSTDTTDRPDSNRQQPAATGGDEQGRAVTGEGPRGGRAVRQLQNGAVTENHNRQLLVMPDRDAAEEVMERLATRLPDLDDPQLVRDALAGEDDAEDAQWLVVLEAPEDGWTAGGLAVLDELATAQDGWREED